jgi:hypothetical protein
LNRSTPSGTSSAQSTCSHISVRNFDKHTNRLSFTDAKEITPHPARGLAAALLTLCATPASVSGDPLLISILSDYPPVADPEEAIHFALPALLPIILMGAAML